MTIHSNSQEPQAMPIHDWTRVPAGVFHDFHNDWVIDLKRALNHGVLPKGYYAMSEQHGGKYIADVLTLQIDPAPPEPPRPMEGGVAVAEAPPGVGRRMSLSAAASSRRKTLTIRHVSRHRIVALVEIVSQSNKDRDEHVAQFAGKAEDAIRHGIHLLLIDLFPPGAHDRNGMHSAVWERLGDEPESLPGDRPLTLASYVADVAIDAYVEHLAVGNDLPSMPLFLDPDYYVNVPLESTYQTAWDDTPEYWRDVLRGVAL